MDKGVPQKIDWFSVPRKNGRSLSFKRFESRMPFHTGGSLDRQSSSRVRRRPCDSLISQKYCNQHHGRFLWGQMLLTSPRLNNTTTKGKKKP